VKKNTSIKCQVHSDTGVDSILITQNETDTHQVTLITNKYLFNLLKPGKDCRMHRESNKNVNIQYHSAEIFTYLD